MATLLEIYGNIALLPTIPPDRQSLQGTVSTGILNGGSPDNIYKPNNAYGFGDTTFAPPSAFNNPSTYSEQGAGVDLSNIPGNDAVHF